MIVYRGKSYPSREIMFDEQEVTVCTEQLEGKLLHDMEHGETEEIANRAHDIDTGIFWYCNEEEYAMEAEMLSAYIKGIL